MINFWYVVAAALFIFGLKKLGSPDSAVKGNMYSAAAMLIAVAVTLFNENILSFDWIIFAAVAGSIIGALAAQRVQMTSMPEMVAIFNGSGGIASLLVGWAALFNTGNTLLTDITVVISIVVGGMTFSGSILAWGKLSEIMNSGALAVAADPPSQPIQIRFDGAVRVPSTFDQVTLDGFSTEIIGALSAPVKTELSGTAKLSPLSADLDENQCLVF